MNKRRRFSLYLMGFGLGAVLAYFTLYKGQNRGYWLPENRVKSTIEGSKIHFSDNALCKLNCLSLNDSMIKEALKKGSVNFKESGTHQKPCPIYVIEQDSLKLVCSVCDSITTVLTISASNNNQMCTCN
jgi:hypothetical protein